MNWKRWPRRAAASIILLLTALSAASLPAQGQGVCGLGLPVAGPHDATLRQFAARHRIEYVEAFVAVINTIHETGRLPDCYVAKGAAEAKGWREGGDLWRAAPGAAIGGNRYDDREHRLPPRFEGRYREADLDYAGGHRGAHRLIYVEGSGGQWLVWFTPDHYRHLYPVPAED